VLLSAAPGPRPVTKSQLALPRGGYASYPMRERALSLLMRPTSPPLALGIGVAVVLTAAETLVGYPLRHIAPEISLGVVYLLGVLVVSTVWGLALGVATAVLSTAAFDFFLVGPPLALGTPDPKGQAGLVIHLCAALLFSFVAALARSRAIEADERRREADLAAEMAGRLLRTDDVRSALPGAARRLAETLGLPAAAIELGPVVGENPRSTFPLRDGATLLGTLLVPAELPQGTERRLRARVVPSVEAILRVALDRAGIVRALEASRDELGVLASEQAALRRVATLVAQGVPPEELFAAVVEEMGRLIAVDLVNMWRHESDGTVTLVAAWSRTGTPVPPVGSRWTLEGKNLSTLVCETGRPVRIDDYADASGLLAAAIRGQRVRSAVAAPIIVEGRLWGVIATGSTEEQPQPPHTEVRLDSFTALVATAIANAESRAAVAASRARVVATADETRRRIERDLHDGIQQQLVSLMLELRAAHAAGPSELGELRTQLAQTERGLARALEELREISRGIHPAILSKGGLEPALRALARRSALSVELDLRAERRPPQQVEVAVYYVVSEALTNAAKHARASVVHVDLEIHHAILRLAIRDDGIGGADPGRGSGLVGLSDRIEALGGTLEVISPTGSGTTLLVQIPVDGQGNTGSAEP
jgi:signal transduction histidine kinase